MGETTFVDVGHYQVRKNGQGADGDVFLSHKTEEDRIITVLSDGLGSGIKAGVLATLTATMAMRFMAEDIPIRRAADIIMQTLPVCKERRISYATFTIVDLDSDDRVKIIEYDNPPYLLIRERLPIEPEKGEIRVHRKLPQGGKREVPGSALPLLKEAVMYYSEFSALPGDRLVFFSDGVTQSGMGTKMRPLGWGTPSAQRYALSEVRENPEISARELARRIVKEAVANDAYSSKDDITCGVIYFRQPRRLLVISGPSVEAGRDREMAEKFDNFPGRKIICGGTTATIISRELGRRVTVSMKNIDPLVPPAAAMEGADLITEGIITLGQAAEMLEGYDSAERGAMNPAARLVEFFLDSDKIDFLVGTKINDAHQDPSMPVELEIRRNIVKRIAGILKEKFLKEIRINYI